MDIQLFDAKINDKGRSLIFRMKKWASFFYVCALFTLILDFIDAYLILRSLLRKPDAFHGLIKLEWIAAFFFVIFFGILAILSARFFYLFASQSTTAVKVGNESAYNDALEFLLKHIIISFVLFIVNSVWLIVVIYVDINLIFE